MLKGFFSQNAEDIEPRFIDIEGFDATRRRHMRDYFMSTVSIAAICTAGFLAQANAFLSPSTSLAGLFACAAGGVFGAIAYHKDQRNFLRKHTALDEATIDRHGRKHDTAFDSRTLRQQLEAYRQNAQTQFNQIAKTSALVGVAYPVTVASNMPITGMLILFGLSAVVPYAANAWHALWRVKQINARRYTFCYPPARASERVVELDASAIAATRAQTRLNTERHKP